MESLNISKLNLSSVRSHTSTANSSKGEMSETNTEPNLYIDDDPYNHEYREEIWNTLLEQDAEKPKIHLQSPQLEFRGTLVQHLRDVTNKLGLCMSTLHSAVALLDLFMDAHRLRSDRLSHVALACLSLAAKSEEKFSRAPTLKVLAKTSGVSLCGKTFGQLEWMIGQHVRWRLLAPTPAAFASLLRHCIAADAVTAHHKFRAKFQSDAYDLLDKYLDLTLSDVRLCVVESVDVGCACVASARAALGLAAWPPWLARRTRRPSRIVQPLASLLHRMMKIMKSRESGPESDVDQGYGSARTSPNVTPSTSPSFHVSPASSTCSSSSLQNTETYRYHPIPNHSVLDMTDTDLVTTTTMYHLPAVDVTVQRVNNAEDYRYLKARRLIDSEPGTSGSVAVKRGLDSTTEIERKRYRLSTQMSQVVL